MKTSIISLIGPFSSGSGVLSGVFWRETTTQFKTIEQVLEMENREILTTNETTKDNEWFILAQKYQKESNKKNSGETLKFLEKTSEELSEEEFSKYETLISKLKKKCSESLKKSYSSELYQNVLKWCRYKIPDYAKEIFSVQREKKCILKVVRNFTNSKEEKKTVELFVWDMLDHTHSSIKNKNVFSISNVLDNVVKNNCENNKVLKIEYKLENNTNNWQKIS